MGIPPDIAESYFEYKASLSFPMFKAWTPPNALIEGLFPALKKWKVGLSDISWNRNSGSLQDLQLTFNVTDLRAIIKIGLDSLSCVAVNPDWSEAASLVELFSNALEVVCKVGKTDVSVHENSLAMHVRGGDKTLDAITAGFVNEKALGPAQMYGVSIYQQDFSLVLDKSARYENAVFVRIYRKLAVGIDFVQVAKTLYEDEVKALALLGLRELIEEAP